MLNPGDRAKRSEVLRKLLISLSTQEKISDESFEQMAKDVEFIYSEGYRQQYSDLLNMLISIRNEGNHSFDDQNLCDNLESLSEYIRDSRKEGGGNDYKYTSDAFLGITKLTDHIILEVQRNRDYAALSNKVWRAQREAHKEAEQLRNEVDKAKSTVKKARKEAQSSKMELVAILSIFAALVIAFSGGLSYLGGTISSSGDAAIGSTVFSVLICGLMLFNIIAFLMIMVVVIVRLNRGEGEPILSPKMTASIVIMIAAFDIILIVAMYLVISSGTVVL